VNVVACRSTITADLRQIVQGVLFVFAALFPIVSLSNPGRLRRQPDRSEIYE